MLVESDRIMMVVLVVVWLGAWCGRAEAETVKVIRTEEGTMPDKHWRVELDNPLQELETFTICARFYSHQFRKGFSKPKSRLTPFYLQKHLHNRGLAECHQRPRGWFSLCLHLDAL